MKKTWSDSHSCPTFPEIKISNKNALELFMEWKQARFPAKANLREMKLCYNVYSEVQVRMFSSGHVNANFKLKLIVDAFSVRKKVESGELIKNFM